MRIPKQAETVMRKGNIARIGGGVGPSFPLPPVPDICDYCRKHPSTPICSVIRCL